MKIKKVVFKKLICGAFNNCKSVTLNELTLSDKKSNSLIFTITLKKNKYDFFSCNMISFSEITSIFVNNDDVRLTIVVKKSEFQKFIDTIQSYYFISTKQKLIY
jgi:hypothetical protein